MAKRKSVQQPISKPWRHRSGGRRASGEVAYDSRLLLYLYREDHDQWRRAAEVEGVSLSLFVRDAVERRVKAVLTR